MSPYEIYERNGWRRVNAKNPTKDERFCTRGELGNNKAEGPSSSRKYQRRLSTHPTKERQPRRARMAHDSRVRTSASFDSVDRID